MTACHELHPLDLEQLEALWIVTADGDLISKSARDRLVAAGKAERGHGCNWLTADGVLMLKQMRALRVLEEAT